MIVYVVYSKYYDNGKTEAYMRQYELDSIPENKYEEKRDYDLYTEYFTNKKDAERAVDEVRKA